MAVTRPGRDWLDHAAAVGVEAIAGDVLDACAVHGGVADRQRQHLLLNEPAGGWANPRLLGWVHEWGSTAVDRSRRGAYYTPPDFAAAVIDAALDGLDRLPGFIVDPACGGAVFLLEVLDRLCADGVAPIDCVGRIAGIEIDRGAANAARLAVEAWQLFNGVATPVDAAIVEQDALDPWPGSWPSIGLVVGNPPFASPLKSGAIPDDAVAYRTRHAEVLGPYADLAAIHLWRAIQALDDGGRVAFVAPVSVINARDTGRLWKRFESEADALSVLIPEANPFEASIRVFVPVFEVRRQARSARRSLPHAVGLAIGLPELPSFEALRPLGSIAGATSGFRDEFYGLAEHVREEHRAEEDVDDPPDGSDVRKLVTVGSIEPLDCSWGRRQTRFAKAKWDRPVVDSAALAPRVAAFVASQSGPKVLVATQTKVLEPVVDPVGDLVGVTPTIIVTTERPGHVAAVLLAPPVNAAALQRWFGTGLSETALRPTAATLLELPVPVDSDLWDQAATLVLEATATVDGNQRAPSGAVLLEIASLMNRAYGADDHVLSWWRVRAGLADHVD